MVSLLPVQTGGHVIGPREYSIYHGSFRSAAGPDMTPLDGTLGYDPTAAAAATAAVAAASATTSRWYALLRSFMPFGP